MKFLLLAKPKPLPASVSRKLYGYLVEQAVVCLQQLWLRGELLSFWGFQSGGSAAVIQADSLAKLEENLKHYPLYRFFSWEVNEVIDTPVLSLLVRQQIL
ncbi:MAG: hypothetical protein AAB956_00150 [Patescibacteria group bacterium]